MPKLIFDGSKFVARIPFEWRHRAKADGFRWDPTEKVWSTENPQVAASLRQYADESAEEEIKRRFIQVTPWTGRIRWPKGLKPKPFQTSAANFLLARNRAYLAADPGLGKTIIAALVGRALSGPVVFITPPGLVYNVQAEIQKWWPKCDAKIYQSMALLRSGSGPEILIVPDTCLDDKLGDHDALRRLLECFENCGAALFIDEAQRFSHMSAGRTRALMDIAKDFKRVYLMSGTPMRNRPFELYPILSNFAGETINFMTENEYGMKYCGGKWDGFGWDYKGASNVGELFDKVRDKFMLRLRKEDVLRDLPPKTEELLFIGDGPKKITTFEQKHFDSETPKKIERLKRQGKRDAEGLMGELAKYRRLLGRETVPYAVDIIKEMLALGDERLLVFCHHREVIEAIALKLKSHKPIVVDGRDSSKSKQAKVLAFQNGDSDLFIGQTQACGTGFTLTRASRTLHVEPSWVPADNSQADDRAHRIGQTEHVYSQYLVFRNSMARKIIESNLRKREIINLI